MNRLRLAFVLVSLGSALAGTAPAMGANATVCHYLGAPSYLTPPVELMGGSGTFGFSGIAQCAANGGAKVEQPMVADGIYVNTICGTGTADGTATIYGIPRFTFHIDFLMGEGRVTIGGPPAGTAHLSVLSPGTAPECVRQFEVT